MPQYSVEQREDLTNIAVEKRVRGWTYSEIGDELGVTRQTAKRWIAAEYAKTSEHRCISDAREEAIAHYRSQIREAWARLQKLDSRSYNASGFLNSARQAQERIDKLTGVETPVKYQEVEDEVEIFWDDGYPLEEAEEAGNAPATAP